jgi:uncharacterized alkaline shock family protein YloU
LCYELHWYVWWYVWKEETVTTEKLQPGPGRASPEEAEIGTVRIAPEVLATIAALTAQGVPGVVRLQSKLARKVGKLFGRGHAFNGVTIELVGDEVWVEVHLIVSPDVSMFKLGRQVQDEVAQAIETMVGMSVHAVDVYIEDVE